MPRKPKSPCAFPGCPNLTDKRYCPEHESLENKRYDTIKIKRKGMQISFNASDEVAGTVVMKLLKELGTEE